MDALIQLFSTTLAQVWTTFLHNWPFLLMSVLIATLLSLYTDSNKVASFLLRHQKAGIFGATAAAVATPLCSCGTTAVVLGMMASMLPWAPVVAFMVASPLTSPEELFYSAGLFGWPFAITFFISSIFLGLFGGVTAAWFERRGWLKNQARYNSAAGTTPPVRQRQMVDRPVFTPTVPALALAYSPCSCESGISACETASACDCGSTATIFETAPSCDCGSSTTPQTTTAKVTLANFLKEAFNTAKRLLPMFLGFAFIGYFINGLIPAAWVSAIFGKGNIYSVPLAATLGLPLYVNSEASLPLVRALIDNGMSQGAALAFLITGAGTSVGAIMGALTIARWRVIGLVVGVLWIGAIVAGYLFNTLLAAGII
jgi:uncharacterized protein